MTIEIEYNEFSNWEFPVKVRHPECEHEDTEQAMKPNGDPLDRAYYCLVCGAIGIVEEPDEDGSVDTIWEYEK